MPVPNTTPAVEVEALSFGYAVARKNGNRLALDGVSFQVQRGQIFGLLGPNGGGKTTLFRILSTSLVATGGTARIFGRDVAKEPRAVREKIGVVFQAPSLDKKLTIRENLRHQGHLYGLHGQDLVERVREMIDRVGLSDRANHLVETLSRE